MSTTTPAPHAFSNYKKVIALANHDWDTAESGRVSGLNVVVKGPNQLMDQFSRTFHHFCTTSYLGLDYHPDILQGAIEGLNEAGTLRIANSKNRCKLSILDQYEAELSQLLGASCLSSLSCSAASAGLLPLIACGTFTRDRPPVMVFDKLSHYSMNHLKAACADETLVVTAPHNDMDFLEGHCKKYPKVAYVADGVYSMGGIADLDSLLYLKNRYGLFLYLDDSHAISAVGNHGAGYVRPRFDVLDEDILIVASLAKSFGASGGVIMFGSDQQKKRVHRYGGPSNWSQSLNAAAIGAGRASIRLHSTPEFTALQLALQANIQLFDGLIHTAQHGSSMAIRLVTCGEAAYANKVATDLAEAGFFTSAVFFPVVAQGKAAIRVTLRADMTPALISAFCCQLTALLSDHR